MLATDREQSKESLFCHQLHFLVLTYFQWITWRSKKNRIEKEEIMLFQSPSVATAYNGKGEMSIFDSEAPLLL